MRVDAFIFMLLVDMALLAGNLFLGIDGVVVCNHAAQDLMILGLVAVGTLHIEVAAHVDVIVFRGEVQAFIQVAVLDAISAAAIEVALPAVLTSRARTDRADASRSTPSAGLPYSPLP